MVLIKSLYCCTFYLNLVKNYPMYQMYEMTKQIFQEYLEFNEETFNIDIILYYIKGRF